MPLPASSSVELQTPSALKTNQLPFHSIFWYAQVDGWELVMLANSQHERCWGSVPARSYACVYLIMHKLILVI